MSETSVQDGTPVYKFAFVNGATTYRYTSASFEMTDPNGTYTPEPISFTNIITTSEIAKNAVSITLPRDNTLAGIFLGQVPEEATSLTVYRGHTPTLEGDIYWKGRVASAEVGRDSVTLNCEDIFTSMQRPGLRARYQKNCRHPLYSTDCGVTQASFSVSASINAISGFTITVDPISQSPELDADYFAGGIIELSDGTKRSIVSQGVSSPDGIVLTLISPFNDLSVTSPQTSCTLYPGCDHTTTDCKNRFNNLLNYGGFPYLPSKNPFQGNVTGSIL